jgi:hypothetical protein
LLIPFDGVKPDHGADATIGPILEADFAAVTVCDGLRDGQSQAGTAGVRSVRARLVGAVETFKDVRQVFWGDAGASVGDDQFSEISIG